MAYEWGQNYGVNAHETEKDEMHAARAHVNAALLLRAAGALPRPALEHAAAGGGNRKSVVRSPQKRTAGNEAAQPGAPRAGVPEVEAGR